MLPIGGKGSGSFGGRKEVRGIMLFEQGMYELRWRGQSILGWAYTISTWVGIIIAAQAQIIHAGVNLSRACLVYFWYFYV